MAMCYSHTKMFQEMEILYQFDTFQILYVLSEYFERDNVITRMQ